MLHDVHEYIEAHVPEFYARCRYYHFNEYELKIIVAILTVGAMPGMLCITIFKLIHRIASRISSSTSAYGGNSGDVADFHDSNEDDK
ncbi:MAG: hypothetical protein U0I27_02975 [Christensenellales bacterium]|nr:hypothetical protein [Christensenellales bacterium]